MKVLNFLICTGLLCVTLSGCGIGGYWMNGNPNIGPSYPYGAHWIKEGMTTESWRQDWVACGGMKDGSYAAGPRLPGETGDIAASDRKARQLATCMQYKGYKYHYTGSQ